MSARTRILHRVGDPAACRQAAASERPDRDPGPCGRVPPVRRERREPLCPRRRDRTAARRSWTGISRRRF